MGYKEDASYDRFSLDEAVERHTDLFVKWGEEWAAAVEAKDQAKVQLDLVKTECKEEIDLARAKLDDEVRHNYKEHGFKEKPTVQAIENWIIKHQDYQKVLEETRLRLYDAAMNLAEYQGIENRMKIAKEAFEHRKKMLELDMDGIGRNLWGIPKQPRTIQRRIDNEKAGEVNEKIGQQLSETMKRRRPRP